MAGHDGGPTRVMVVDDHQTFAELLAGALDREPDLVSVGHATTAAEAILMRREVKPDVVMMDLRLADSDDGFAATQQITDEAPWTRVIVLTAQSGGVEVARARRAGACAYLLKDGSLADLLRTLRGATVGRFEYDPALRISDPTISGPGGWLIDAIAPTLTQREHDVLALLAEGDDVRSIARRLAVTEATCRGYVKSLLVKLDAHSQLQAVVAGWRLGLLPWKVHD